MLVKLLAVGRCEDHLVIMALCLQGRDATVNGLTLHHHSGKSAIGIVVNTAPLVFGVVAQVVQMYLGKSFLLCPCQYRFVHEALEHLRQYGYNVYSHKCKVNENFC